MDMDTLKAECLACTRCELCATRTNVVFGQGVPDAEVLFVGEGPGQSEDEQGLPFVGRSGQLLDKYLFAIDLDRSKNCYIANIVKCRPPQNRDPLRREPGMQLVLLKSGPGCGKSTLMKRLARTAQDKGEPIQRIHCASDPDSLDGVVFLRQKRAIIDATAPHVVEPEAPGADERVLSLYHTIDADALHPHKDEVTALFARNQLLRSRAARYVASAGSLLLDSRRAEACSANFEKVRRYVKRLCTRLLPRTEEMGSEELRLLSAITPKGEVFYQGTVQALADRCILFRDDYGAVSRLLLELIRAEALARGYHIITCPCAMHPEDKIDHILIPSLRLAFLTDNRWHPVRLSAAQTVRCSRFVDRENLSACRARLRFNERAAAELLEQACALMAQAKSCHDELETYYRTAVDFAQVDAAAAQCMELFGVG